MSVVLLDTNIVSYMFKQDSRAQLYATHLIGNELAIAMMTVAELFQWSALRKWGKPRIQRLEQLLESYTILPVDIDLCRQWADVRARRTNAGSPISPQDAWIAATSLRYQIPLVTHNPIDYANIPNLTLISEA